jgi:Protein of unknown function (DUF1588)/Protein of unknown function (DUF1592)/Protein of unknown function (DUF1595)/Protein of unknown function (DUF1585)
MLSLQCRAVAVLTVLVACQGKVSTLGGSISAGQGGSGGGSGGPGALGGSTVPAVALRRLTPREIDRTLSLLTGDPHAHAAMLLPNNSVTSKNPSPFDNDVTSQLASASWIEGVETLANTVAKETLADPARRALVMPCTPTGPQDFECLDAFTASFGKKVLRRPLSTDEIVGFRSLHAQALERGTIDTSLALIITRLLADPEFHFRPEIGTPVSATVVKLTQPELASRLAFFLQGQAPSPWLLDAAAAGQLETPAQIRSAAQKLIESPEGRSQVEQFHAMWLGFQSLPHDAALNLRFVTETRELLKRVIYDEPGDYRRLFQMKETYADADLAAHYGLTPPAGKGYAWIPYGASGRKGILSHGALLSNGIKQSDTSPTLRGKWIQNRLFCREIADPPPGVAMDLPASTMSSPCKIDRLRVHGINGSCAFCHDQMDPIGFGLEQYDRTGKVRTAEDGLSQCLITGEGKLQVFKDGKLQDKGAFNGPAQLADLMISSGAVERCTVKHLFRFMNGREAHDIPEDNITDDTGLIDKLTVAFDKSGRRFDSLLVDVVADETFAFRQVETP